MSHVSISNQPTDSFDEFKDLVSSTSFILKTCQRTLIIEPRVENIESPLMRECPELSFAGPKGYQFLLEVICGLRSRLLGENEIVGQFKEAYEGYLEKEKRNSDILLLLQKLFKDAKDIRTQYLSEVGQYSYAGITKKLISNRSTMNKLLVVGSGQLAEDILKVMHRKFDIHLLARNEEKVKELKNNYDFKILDWAKFNDAARYATIVNTIGSKEVLFSEKFFKTYLLLNGQKSLFIDLGSPSAIETNYDVGNGVIRLQDIFEMSEQLNQEKKGKIHQAMRGVEEVVQKRWSYLRKKSLMKSGLTTDEQSANC